MQATLTQRKYDIWASNLLFLGFGLSLLFDYLLKSGYFANDIGQLGLIIMYVSTPLILVFYYLIRKGNIYAKTTYLVLFGLVLIISVTDIPEFATRIHASSYLSQRAMELAAWVLLILSLRLVRRDRLNQSS